MKKINADRVISVSAILLSVATLAMIFYQTSLTRKEQKASVMPSLEIGYSTKGSGDNMKESIWVSNRGLGPAFIEEVRIIDNNKTIETDPYGFLSEIQTGDRVSYFDRLYQGKIIPANDGLTTYEKVTDSTSQIILRNSFKFPYGVNSTTTNTQDAAVIEIIYKSVYGDTWKIRSDQTTPIKLD